METTPELRCKKGGGALGKRRRFANIDRRPPSPSRSVVMNKVGHPLVRELGRLFKANGDAAHALAQSKYLKNRFPAFGLYTKRRRELLKEASARHPIETADELFVAVDHLWQQEEREFQHAGFDLLHKHHKLWPVNHTTLSYFEKYITEKSWWDTVDCLASNCVGTLLKKDLDAGGPQRLQEEMDDWVRDENMWKRRTALLHQLRYKDTVDEERLFSYCEQLMHEKEFFIRKAIGWALRNHSRQSRAAVAAFVEKNRSKLASLSLKEASKYL